MDDPSPAGMRGFRIAVSARANYAVRALVVLALEPPSRPVKATTIADRDRMPPRFLANILPDLCRAGIVGSRRGGEGGYWLARPASAITVAEIIRAVEPPARRVPVAQDIRLLDGLQTSLQEAVIAALEGTRLLDVVPMLAE